MTIDDEGEPVTTGSHGAPIGAPLGAPDGPTTPHRGTGMAEVRDAVSLRATLLVVSTLLLGLGFVLSYVGALHSPKLQNAPITVVSADPQATQQLVAQLSQASGGAVTPSAGTTEAAARDAVADRSTAAAFVYNVTGSQDTLIVASAAGSAQASAIEKLFIELEVQSDRTLSVDDVVPAGAEDFDGLSAFYLVVGWSVTGYLIASILGLSAGTRPANLTRAVIRLVALALCGLVAGLIGTLLVQEHVLGALGGEFWPMVATGALLVFGVGAITMALEIAFGIVGIGLAVLLVVVLGNPSAGGAFPRAMLPPFWRAIGAFLPPGAGTDAVRSIAYFGGERSGYPLLILGGYALLGLALSLLLCLIRPPTSTSEGVLGSAMMNDDGTVATTHTDPAFGGTPGRPPSGPSEPPPNPPQWPPTTPPSGPQTG
ncbi:hypothetical protein KDL01_32705 [Actinospica durhamensis]|uniref:DUF3533 domain-containing protein n=1 Tax=Actinospica durhamensis TaxID=1508375 RepID=A0A941IQU4_9ACTN|nr:hypothetical protein [Actinospica durhamensis]MBR7838080.1 hypothetical protein [Actinospica durhamensis]